MNSLAHWMMRLYPSRWRRRYGDELNVLLADTGADARVVADLLKGGVRMQFSTWSFTKLAVVLGIGGVLLGAAGSFLITPMYVSKATVRAEPLAEVMQQVEPILLSRSSLAGIIMDPRLRLYPNELKVRPLEDVIAGMQSDIRIDPVSTSSFTISFQYPDPAKASQTLAALIQKFDVASFELKNTLPGQIGDHAIQVVDTASLPVETLIPHRQGELAGAVLGLLTALAWRRFRKKTLVSWWLPSLAIPLILAGTIAADLALMPFDDTGNLFGLPYRSTAVLSIENRTTDQIEALEGQVLSRTSLSEIVTDSHLKLYQDKLKNQPLEDVVQTMRQHLTITPDAGGHYFTVSFVYKDRHKAQQTVQAILNRFDDENRRLYGSVANVPATPMQWGRPATLESPSLPVLPVSPDRYKITGEGGLAGLIAAAIVAMIRRRWKPEPDIPLDPVSE